VAYRVTAPPVVDGNIADKHNRTDDKTAPLYIETAPADFADAMVLLKSEIDSGEAVEVAGLTAEQLQAAWDQYASLNAREHVGFYFKVKGGM